jgi:hypothetical protein
VASLRLALLPDSHDSCAHDFHTLPDPLRELFLKSTANVTEEAQVQEILHLLQSYQDVFVMPGGALGVGAVEPHRIDTEDNAPVKQRSYRMSADAHKVVQTECAKMLELGVI